MTLYPLGTLVRIQKIMVNSLLTDVSEKNMVGYITYSASNGLSKYPEWAFYEVYIFQEGRKFGVYHHYLVPLEE